MINLFILFSEAISFTGFIISIHESEDWPGPVTLGNPKPLDCNIQGIRFLPRGNFYPLPCGVVGRAQGTTLFVKIRSVLGSIPPGVTKKFLEWNRGTSVEIGLWHLATLECPGSSLA